MNYTFPLPEELQVGSYTKELALLPTEMSAYLMAEFLHRDWRSRRSTETIQIDSGPIVRYAPRWFPTDDPRFLKHGIATVDIANLGLLQLPSDIFSENLLDARILISLCERELEERREFSSDFYDASTRYVHNLWWKRNYLRLVAENRGDVCRDLPQLPPSIREDIAAYNIARIKLATEFVKKKLGLLGTMGKYTIARIGLERHLVSQGLLQAQVYNPQVGEDEWSFDLLAVEEAMKSLISFYVFFLGDPLDKIPEKDGTVSINHISPVAIAEVVELTNDSRKRGCVIYDRRGLPSKALLQYDAIIAERVSNRHIPVLTIESGQDDLTSIYDRVYALAFPYLV